MVWSVVFLGNGIETESAALTRIFTGGKSAAADVEVADGGLGGFRWRRVALRWPVQRWVQAFQRWVSVFRWMFRYW